MKSRRAHSKRVLTVAILGVFLGLVVSGLLTTGLLGGSASSGEAAPDVTVSTANGELRLAEQKGKVILLYFSFPG